MLKRTKYSRLRSDSVASVEDCPKRILSLKEDLCRDTDFALLGPGTPTHHGASTVKNFIPRVANIRLQSPVSLHGLGGRTVSDGHGDSPLSCTGWDLGPNERLCGRPFAGEPLSTHCVLSCAKRPITLHRMAGLTQTHRCAPCVPHRDDVCCLKAAPAAEEQTANRVVHHDIKYVGSVEVMQSMRTLNFHTRMQVTREAISTLCERTSAKAAVKTKRPVCKGLSAILGRINLQFSGRRIILAVSTDSVTLIVAASLQKIAHHLMPAISFASGGDPPNQPKSYDSPVQNLCLLKTEDRSREDMGDYIAYVAKDLFNQRACHILECPRGKAREVIDSIGQAFDRRFRQLLSQTPSLLSTSARSAVRLCHKRLPEERNRSQRSEQEGEARKLCDYYNVIPGMTPPTGETEHLQVPDKPDADTQRISLYENCSTTDGRTVPPSAGSVEPEISAEQCPQTWIQDLIQQEGWFHGRLGREQAESLLTCSGDFLVRESSSASGQYVLSGMEGGSVRHLLLVDAHGQVRTHDQVFLSIGHLVRFHMENQLPIVSGSSELFLKQPILQH